MDIEPAFAFVTCQVGAESAVKEELARAGCDARLAFSRPGFLTFKLPRPELAETCAADSVFARAWGVSIGKAEGEDPQQLAERVWQLAGDRRYDRLHVWQRDAAPPGTHGFHPGPTAAAHEADALLRQAHVTRLAIASPSNPHPPGDGPTRRGDLVLDVILVEPTLWWVGYHRAHGPASCWPGGLAPLELPASAVSRTWLKMEEALAWSQLPIEPGQRVVEIGSAPGGSSQVLLSRGLLVTGIDPAAMHADVLAHPNFTHVRKRGADVRRREFRKVRWLTADMNVAPNYTLDTVEAIVTHPEVNIRGLLLTLKLIDWEMAAEIPAYLARVRGWGFAEVQARQLQHNRQEICVAAMRSRPRPSSARGRRRRQASSGRRSAPA